MPETENSSEKNKKPEDKNETNPQVVKEVKSIKRRILGFFSFLHRKHHKEPITDKIPAAERKNEIQPIEKLPSQTPEVAGSQPQPVAQPILPPEVTPSVSPIIHPPEKQVNEISGGINLK